MFDYGSETYNELIKITKLRFGKELQNSGIKLTGLYSMKNLVTKKDCYLLEINSKKIRFADEKAFLVLFANFLQRNIIELRARYKYLVSRQIDEFSDEVGIELEYKRMDYYSIKQGELLKKIIKYQAKLK